jgi:hypothetical protein
MKPPATAAADDGVDRGQIQAKLRLTPEERMDAIRAFTRFVAEARRQS